jgi:hypothetical protein
MRALDHLAHRFCVPYHPIVVAATLCAPDTFTTFSARWLRQLHYPLSTDLVTPTARDVEILLVHRTLAAAGLDPGRLLAPPEPDGDNTLTYCPRCRVGYVVEHGTCADCPGVALVPFTPARVSSAQAPVQVTL